MTTPSDTAHPEGARDAMARLVGSWTVTGGGVDDDDRTVIHDVFPGDYDQRTDRLYALTDAILAAVATPPSRPQGEEGLRIELGDAYVATTSTSGNADPEKRGASLTLTWIGADSFAQMMRCEDTIRAAISNQGRPSS